MPQVSRDKLDMLLHTWSHTTCFGVAAPDAAPDLLACSVETSDSDGRQHTYLALSYYNIPQQNWQGKPMNYHVTVYQAENEREFVIPLSHLRLTEVYDDKEQRYLTTLAASQLNGTMEALFVDMAGVNSAGESESSRKCQFSIQSEFRDSTKDTSYPQCICTPISVSI